MERALWRWKLVDPDGLLAEAEYDMGVLMREDPLEPLEGDAYQRARWLERVSTGSTQRRIAAASGMAMTIKARSSTPGG